MGITYWSVNFDYSFFNMFPIPSSKGSLKMKTIMRNIILQDFYFSNGNDFGLRYFVEYQKVFVRCKQILCSTSNTEGKSLKILDLTTMVADLYLSLPST